MSRATLKYTLLATAAVFVGWAVVHLTLVGTDSVVDRPHALTMVEVESKDLRLGLDLLAVAVLSTVCIVVAWRSLGRVAVGVGIVTGILATLLAIGLTYYTRYALLGRLPRWLSSDGYVYDGVAYSVGVTVVLVAASLAFKRARPSRGNG